MLLGEVIILEEAFFKPIIEQILWPEIVICIQQVSQNSVLLFDQGNLENEDDVLDESFLIIYLVSFVLSEALGRCFGDVYVICFHLFDYVEVAIVHRKV